MNTDSLPDAPRGHEDAAHDLESAEQFEGASPELESAAGEEEPEVMYDNPLEQLEIQEETQEIDSSALRALASYLAYEMARKSTAQQTAVNALARDMAILIVEDRMSNTVGIDAMSERIVGLSDKCAAVGIGYEDLRKMYWNAVLKLVDISS